MAKSTRLTVIPAPPEPSSANPVDGMSEGRELARSYLVDLVDLLASIALSPEAEVSLHTRLLSAKQIIEIAAIVPPPLPEVPPPGDGGDGS